MIADMRNRDQNDIRHGQLIKNVFSVHNLKMQIYQNRIGHLENKGIEAKPANPGVRFFLGSLLSVVLTLSY